MKDNNFVSMHIENGTILKIAFDGDVDEILANVFIGIVKIHRMLQDKDAVSAEEFRLTLEKMFGDHEMLDAYMPSRIEHLMQLAEELDLDRQEIEDAYHDAEQENKGISEIC